MDPFEFDSFDFDDGWQPYLALDTLSAQARRAAARERLRADVAAAAAAALMDDIDGDAVVEVLMEVRAAIRASGGGA